MVILYNKKITGTIFRTVFRKKDLIFSEKGV